MKKIISLVIASVALLGAVSCADNKEGDAGKKGTGELIITFNDIVDTGVTKAATSTNAKPTTTWSKNIKSMVLLLVDGTTITDVRTIELQASDNKTGVSRTFTDVVAGTYSAYIIANFDQTSTPFGSGSISPSTPINASSLKGTNINSLIFRLTTIAAGNVEGTDPGTPTRYGEPSEIFMAVQNNVNVEADKPNTHGTAFSLQRIVSLVRVRLNQTYDSTDPQAVDNSGVKFTNADGGRANFRIRRHGASYNAGTSAVAPATPSASNILYSNKAFKTASDFASESSNYTGDMGLAPHADPKLNYTLYNEYLAFPGGNGTAGDNGELKFDIVIGGLAPIGYKPLENGVMASTGISSPKMVYWGGQVTGAAASNGILELNVRLTGRGSIEIPEVNDYGTLIISINLMDWGAITPVQIEF